MDDGHLEDTVRLDRRRAAVGWLSGLVCLVAALGLAVADAATSNPTLGVVSEALFVAAGILILVALPKALYARRARQIATAGAWTEATCTFVPETLGLEVTPAGSGPSAYLAPFFVSKARYRRLQDLQQERVDVVSEPRGRLMLMALADGVYFVLAAVDHSALKSRWARVVARLWNT